MATGSWDDYKDNQKVFFEDRLYYVVRDKKELKRFVKNDLKMVIKNKVYESDRIITTFITDMDYLFCLSKFHGYISHWDVSNVTTMSGMFASSEFNGDISMWDVSKVEDMCGMFNNSKFNGYISKWDVSRVENMKFMFESSQFNRDISMWDVSNVLNMESMFKCSKFKNDISGWNINKNTITYGMFDYCPLAGTRL